MQENSQIFVKKLRFFNLKTKIGLFLIEDWRLEIED